MNNYKNIIAESMLMDAAKQRVSFDDVLQLLFMNVHSIAYCRSVLGKTEVIFNSGEKYTISKPLSKVAHILKTPLLRDTPSFFRIHRSYLVNISYIKQCNCKTRDSVTVTLFNGVVLNVALYRLKAFMEAFDGCGNNEKQQKRLTQMLAEKGY